MTDSEMLLVVLAVVYLMECLFWVRPGGMVLRRWWGRCWELVSPTGFLANDRGHLCWGNPFPPFGCVHVVRSFPFCLAPQGVRIGGIEVRATVGTALEGEYYAFDALQSIEAEEKKLKLNGEVAWRSDSVHQPAALASLLRSLKSSTPAERAVRIRQELAARLELGAIRSRRTEFAERTRTLQVLALLLFGVLFGLCPLAVWMVGLREALLPMLVGVLILTIAITVFFRRQHRHFYPSAADDRFKLTMLTLLVPAVSIRSRDFLQRGLLEQFHPLAVARDLLSPELFAGFARRSWRELKYPFARPQASGETESTATEDWFRRELLSAYETFLAREKIPSRVWMEPPTATDPSHALFCPRCDTQFTAQASVCVTCGGQALEKLG